jgi:O-succinylbenzoic acid--CoA ligase
VAVPLSTRLPPAEVGRAARRVGCRLLLSESDAVAEARPGAVTVRSPGRLPAEGATRGEDRSLDADRPATILHTSGTTGTPKAALHTWANHLYSAKGANANMPLREGDRWLLTLPLYHVGGLAPLVRCAIAGAGGVLPCPEQTLAENLRSGAVTYLSLVPTQFRRLLAATEGAPPSSLRGVLLGGGPIPSALVRRAQARGWPILASYGCTEMASQVTTTALGARDSALESAGRRLPHRRLRIDDGEIQVAGPPLFEGYVTADGVEDPRTGDGWYATGDRGRIDAAGRLHVLGRIDRMFVSGGENIQPEEIEEVLQQLSGVERAVVVPVPHPEYGARPVAFVDGSDPGTAEGLSAALAERLPGFKIPDAFHPLTPQPDSDGVKVDHEQLERRARALHSSRGDARE